jgi:hypothetical protein
MPSTKSELETIADRPVVPSDLPQPELIGSIMKNFLDGYLMRDELPYSAAEQAIKTIELYRGKIADMPKDDPKRAYMIDFLAIAYAQARSLYDINKKEKESLSVLEKNLILEVAQINEEKTSSMKFYDNVVSLKDGIGYRILPTVLTALLSWFGMQSEMATTIVGIATYAATEIILQVACRYKKKKKVPEFNSRIIEKTKEYDENVDAKKNECEIERRNNYRHAEELAIYAANRFFLKSKKHTEFTADGLHKLEEKLPEKIDHAANVDRAPIFDLAQIRAQLFHLDGFSSVLGGLSKVLDSNKR